MLDCGYCENFGLISEEWSLYRHDGGINSRWLVLRIRQDDGEDLEELGGCSGQLSILKQQITLSLASNWQTYSY